MSNEHYRKTYYSKTEAKAIVKKNEAMMTKRSGEVYKARCGVADYADAKALGITIDEYRCMLDV